MVRRARPTLLVVAALVASLFSPVIASAQAPVRAPLVRVDQAGYLPGDAKFAVVMSGRPLDRPVWVLDDRGRRVLRAVVARRSGWSSSYPDVYGVRFGALSRPGRYRLAIGGTSVRSRWFRVLSAQQLWGRVLAYGVRFDDVQRDGADVPRSILQRKPSHLNDRRAYVYAWPTFQPDSDTIVGSSLRRIGGPVDVAGGWFDAGDFLKFTHTAAYADVLLYTAARDLGASAPQTLLDEAHHGTQWLAKMWNPRTRTLYLQVGIGTGNAAGTFFGDHDLWRLPQRDDEDTAYADRYVSHRPVFLAAAPGHRISPNIVGRTSAAFALAAQVDATRDPARARHELMLATSLYAMADTSIGHRQLLTSLPNEYYPETTWRDDMELGAIEIARALRDLHRPATGYLRAAARFARGYLRYGTGDTFNLYDVSALAHVDLLRTMGAARLAVTRGQLVADLRRQLSGAVARSGRDPFAAGVDDTQFDADSHTFGLIATANWYASVTGSRQFAAAAARWRGWVFGANAWGTSFMVGIGQVFPHCMQHQVANLSGSLDGARPLDLGAVVNGPNGADLFTGGVGGFQDGMRECPGPGASPAVPAGRFDGSGSAYLDDVRSWQTDEPALDMTGAAIVAAASSLG